MLNVFFLDHLIDALACVTGAVSSQRHGLPLFWIIFFSHRAGSITKLLTTFKLTCFNAVIAVAKVAGSSFGDKSPLLFIPRLRVAAVKVWHGVDYGYFQSNGVVAGSIPAEPQDS